MKQEFLKNYPERLLMPHDEDIEGFGMFMERYKAGLSIEKCAIEVMNW